MTSETIGLLMVLLSLALGGAMIGYLLRMRSELSKNQKDAKLEYDDLIGRLVKDDPSTRH